VSTPSSRLTLQWHLTDRCGQACLHCYSNPTEDLGLGDWMRILEQYEDLLAELTHRRGHPVRARLHLTGGEPFLAEGIWEFLECLHRRRLEFAVMTTGLTLDRAQMGRLQELRPAFVQVSLDGGPQTHDRLRGAGNHARVLEAIQRLSKAGLWVSVSFTALKSNFREIPQVVEAARRAGAKGIWSDRLVPCGQAEALMGEVMDAEEVATYVRLLGAQQKAQRRRIHPIRVQAERALQFQGAPGSPYHCSAGSNLITVLADGTLCPCRRMPTAVGKLPQESLRELYFESELMRALRDPGCTPSGCAHCAYRSECRGGLRCLAFALNGDPFTPDPGCGLASLPGTTFSL